MGKIAGDKKLEAVIEKRQRWLNSKDSTLTDLRRVRGSMLRELDVDAAGGDAQVEGFPNETRAHRTDRGRHQADPDQTREVFQTAPTETGGGDEEDRREDGGGGQGHRRRPCLRWQILTR